MLHTSFDRRVFYLDEFVDNTLASICNSNYLLVLILLCLFTPSFHAGAIPFTAATFAFYELTEEYLTAVLGKSRHMRSAAENLQIGCIAAACAQTASFPFDTIRKKLQVRV